MRIVGVFQWFRPYVPNLSLIIAPITQLLKKSEKVTFEWPEEAKLSLKKALKEIKKHSVLSCPDFTERFDIFTDASNTGCGAIIKQGKNIVYFFSHKFTSTESKYIIVEREFLIIILTLSFFRKMLLGNRIKIFTDKKTS